MYAELQANETPDEQQNEILMDWFKINQDAFTDKVDAYIAIIRDYQAKEKAVKDEVKRLQERAKSHASNIDRLKSNLQFAMETFGIDKAKTALNTVSLANSSSISYEVDMDKLPEAYHRVKVEANRTAIQNALKAGVELEGVTVSEPKKSLRIR